MAGSSQTVAGVSVGDGKREAAAAGGNEDQVQHITCSCAEALSDDAGRHESHGNGQCQCEMDAEQ